MTDPIPIALGETGRTTTSVPSGSDGRIEPVSTAYGVAPASRGMRTARARTPATPRTTSQARTCPTHPATARARDGSDRTTTPAIDGSAVVGLGRDEVDRVE